MLDKDVFDFSGKVAVIVGGTSGIGLGTAETLVKLGAKTIIAGRTEKVVDGCEFICCDVTKENSVIEFTNQVIEKYGKVDILINSMAINQCTTIDNISYEDWKNVIDTNISGVFLTCKGFLPYMKKEKYGKIVNISSIAGRNKSIVSGVHYTASKAALIGFSRQLAHEVSQYNINVNVHCPSQTLTPMLENSMTKEELDDLAKKIPLKRIASVDDQIGPILFLCSDASSYMAGSVIDVNGGLL